MSASIFSETELARLASFPEEIPSDDLIRAFTLTGADRDLVVIRRGAVNRLGLALQLYLASAEGAGQGATRLLRCATALRVTPPLRLRLKASSGDRTENPDPRSLFQSGHQPLT